MHNTPEEASEKKTAGKRLFAVADDGFEATFRRDYPVVWLLTLVGPLLVTILLVGLIYLWVGTQYGLDDAKVYVRKLVATAVGTFFFAGKFVILAGSQGKVSEVQSFFTAGQLFLMVLYMDLMTALLLVFHVGFLFRLPILGSKLGELIEDGQFILKSNPWMKRATFVGIIAFVMFPLAATGSVGGSIFGRLLGMGRVPTLIGITIGSVLGCGMMYFGAGVINQYISRDNLWLKIGGGLVIAGVIVLLNLRYRQLKAQHLAEEAQQGHAAVVGSRDNGKRSA